MDTFNMKKIETILESVILSYSRGLSEETVDILFNYYLQQIERLKNSLQTDRINKHKYNQLNRYINLALQMSNENVRLKNHVSYEKSISEKF